MNEEVPSTSATHSPLRSSRKKATQEPLAGLEEVQLIERHKTLRRHELSAAQVQGVVESVTVSLLSYKEASILHRVSVPLVSRLVRAYRAEGRIWEKVADR